MMSATAATAAPCGAVLSWAAYPTNTQRRCHSPVDQHPVGDRGPDGQHEPFVEAVRPRTPRRDLEHFDARVRQDRVGLTALLRFISETCADCPVPGRRR